MKNSNKTFLLIHGAWEGAWSWKETTTYLEKTNPTGDFISIESDKPVRRILLFDITGKEIVRVETPQFPLNLSGLHSGIYFLQLDIDDQLYTTKIIKE